MRQDEARALPQAVQAESKGCMQTRAHAAAALGNIKDVTLLRGIGCLALTHSIKEASAALEVMEVSVHKHCHAWVHYVSNFVCVLPPARSGDCIGILACMHFLQACEHWDSSQDMGLIIDCAGWCKKGL